MSSADLDPPFCPVTQLEFGPAEHGVVRYARRVRRGLIELDRVPVALDDPRCVATHVHFTDRLFGTTPAAAATAFEELAARARSRALGVVVTLHDVPQASDGSSEAARRDCYRRVARAADGVLVSSEHERRLCGAGGIDSAAGGGVGVIPLAIDMSDAHFFRQPPRRSVAVLGFLYPGKGHIEVLRALPDDAEFVALGTTSPGHEHLVDELNSEGRQVEVTGYLSDAALLTAMCDVAVPVAHHRHLSASASISSWIEAGRAPLVVRSDYAEEVAARSPGALTLYDEEDLPGAIVAALANPTSTWLAPGVDPRPTLRDVAAAHLDAYERWFG